MSSSRPDSVINSEENVAKIADWQHFALDRIQHHLDRLKDKRIKGDGAGRKALEEVERLLRDLADGVKINPEKSLLVSCLCSRNPEVKDLNKHLFEAFSERCEHNCSGQCGICRLTCLLHNCPEFAKKCTVITAEQKRREKK
jgi:hypothetical protein